MKKAIPLGVMLLLVPFVALAGGAGESVGKAADLSGQVQIAGSSTVYPISTAIAEEFHKVAPGVVVAIQSTGTGGGFKNFFLPGKTDINDASRPIKNTEIETAKKGGFDPLEFLVGTDAVTIVVSPEAIWVDNITVEQLKKIWQPENSARKWSDVDPSWPAEKIELYGPTAASGTFEYFTEEIIGKAGASRSDYQATEQDNTIVAAVSGSKYAMGYFGMAYYLENQKKVKALSVNGVKPSLETAKSGQYTPLSRPLFIYVNSESVKNKPAVKAFVEYYLDQIDTSLISEVGYVPLTKDEAMVQRDKLTAAIGM